MTKAKRENIIRGKQLETFYMDKLKLEETIKPKKSFRKAMYRRNAWPRDGK